MEESKWENCVVVGSCFFLKNKLLLPFSSVDKSQFLNNKHVIQPVTGLKLRYQPIGAPAVITTAAVPAAKKKRKGGHKDELPKTVVPNTPVASQDDMHEIFGTQPLHSPTKRSKKRKVAEASDEKKKKKKKRSRDEMQDANVKVKKEKATKKRKKMD